jgi:hypothetical protein
MEKAPDLSPGTVSKILWHFTGGPKWNDQTNRQAERKKPAAAAFKALCSIMKNQELKLGTYTEIVRTEHEEILSAPVCCLADIPVVHLGYHQIKYGKFAIGFHRSAAIRSGFNPVFYSPEYAEAAGAICHPLFDLRVVNTGAIASKAQEIEEAVRVFAPQIDRISILLELASIKNEAEKIATFVEAARESLLQFAAYVKTFEKDEFATVYCEREWRALKSFNFSYQDVAMIVLPRCVGKRQYFEEFVTKVLPRINLSRSIPIVPWEDLVEH